MILRSLLLLKIIFKKRRKIEVLMLFSKAWTYNQSLNLTIFHQCYQILSFEIRLRLKSLNSGNFIDHATTSWVTTLRQQSLDCISAWPLISMVSRQHYQVAVCEEWVGKARNKHHVILPNSVKKSLHTKRIDIYEKPLTAVNERRSSILKQVKAAVAFVMLRNFYKSRLCVKRDGC